MSLPPNLGIDLDPVRHPEGCRPGLDCERWHIAGARVIDPAHGVDAIRDVFLDAGRIKAYDTPPEDFAHARRIDAHGRWLIPGVIDLWARLREPGAEHKATVASEAAAAVSAGITTLCLPPDTDPVLDTVAVARFVKRRAQLAGRARVLCIGALTQGLRGELLSEMAELAEGGCVALSNTHLPMKDLRLTRRALEYAATFGITVIVRPLDASLSRNGCAHEGPIATRLGLPPIPVSAETAPLAQLIALMEETGARVHVLGVSSAAAVRMIERARRDGLPLSASVSAHQLWLSEMDTDAFDPNCHLLPPLRSLRDRDALRQGLADGTLGAVFSDHQPHEEDAKLAPFPETEPGLSGLETLLPLTLKLAEDGVLPLNEAIARLTRGPAEALGLTDCGGLAVGQRADLALIDPDTAWSLDADTLISAGRNTPFHGWDFTGRVSHTWVSGRLVHGAAEPAAS